MDFYQLIKNKIMVRFINYLGAGIVVLAAVVNGYQHSDNAVGRTLSSDMANIASEVKDCCAKSVRVGTSVHKTPYYDPARTSARSNKKFKTSSYKTGL
jgi:hypothetical protein